MIWTIAAAVFGLIAAVGVIVEITITAATRTHGQIGIVATPLKPANKDTQALRVEFHAFGNLIATNPAVTAFPPNGITEVISAPEPLVAGGEPYVVEVALPAAPGATGKRAYLALAYVRSSGFRPTLQSTILVPSTRAQFFLRRGWRHPFVRAWYPRSPVRKPKQYSAVLAGDFEPVKPLKSWKRSRLAQRLKRFPKWR